MTRAEGADLAELSSRYHLGSESQTRAGDGNYTMGQIL